VGDEKEARRDHPALLTGIADWAMLHCTSRTGKQDGIYLALNCVEKSSF
jgi:hypothetical protein